MEAAKIVEPLTPRQDECLRAIISLHREEGRPPSYREIAARMGLRMTCLNSCHQMVKVLVRKGRVILSGGHSSKRDIRVVGERCPTCRGLGVIPKSFPEHDPS